MLQYTFLRTALVVSLIAAPINAFADQPMAAGTDADYVAKVMTAAPAGVANGATILQMQKDGTMRTVRSGANGFTCLTVPGDVPTCADKNAMAWMQALMKHAAPPSDIGFMYMLAGDGAGASNTDPFATAPTSSNHWVKTGPHVMIVGQGAKSLGYPMTADADPTKPYIMWANTPYAHAMIPVGGQPK
jgi:hypothetical protein